MEIDDLLKNAVPQNNCSSVAVKCLFLYYGSSHPLDSNCACFPKHVRTLRSPPLNCFIYFNKPVIIRHMAIIIQLSTVNNIFKATVLNQHKKLSNIIFESKHFKEIFLRKFFPKTLKYWIGVSRGRS